ncbi:MAG: hypothetical protein RBT55_13295 [Rhodocyclaceae bacterium]|jgi:hypothetical protein|nr:hypothetical protein [Rhodocyclaceae bacterium]
MSNETIHPESIRNAHVPAWFYGSAQDYATLARLMKAMRRQEALRRRRLIGRTVGIGSLAALLVAGLSNAVMASSGLTELGLTASSAGILGTGSGIVLILLMRELYRFMESHVTHMDGHVRFARLAGRIVESGQFSPTQPVDDPLDRLIQAELTRIADAMDENRKYVPALCRTGFTTN